MRGLLAFLFCLLTVAAQASVWGGYSYSCSTVAVNCDGVSVTYIEPAGYAGTNGETDDTAFVWVGIFGNTHGTQCTLGSGNNNPLIQFGTAPTQFSNGTQTHATWYEEAPCNNVTNYGSLTINAGDSITLELLCTANCSAGDATANWRMTWTNNTTGNSINRTDTNWQVYGDNIVAVIEGASSGAGGTSYQPLHFTKMKFSNLQFHYSNAWHAVPIIAKSPWAVQREWQQVATGSNLGTLSLYGPSPPTGPLGNDYWVCESIVVGAVTSIAPDCPASAYTSSNGVGP